MLADNSHVVLSHSSQNSSSAKSGYSSLLIAQVDVLSIYWPLWHSSRGRRQELRGRFRINLFQLIDPLVRFDCLASVAEPLDHRHLGIHNSYYSFRL